MECDGLVKSINNFGNFSYGEFHIRKKLKGYKKDILDLIEEEKMTNKCTFKGISIIKDDKYSLCHIDYFSDELKNAIRKNLSQICYGMSKASSSRITYNYHNTLKGFLDRYEKKTSETKKGMIGELLTHILILNYFSEFNIVSPYFNLEEKSIKKGFDVVLFSIENKELWITEVKSGELHKDKNSNETTKELLSTAKNDLKKRLNENKNTFWQTAINGAMIAVDGSQF